MAVLEQRKTLFVNSGTQADKYLVQFSIWNRGVKNLYSLYDSREVHTKKNNKNFCENDALKKSFHFSIKNYVENRL